MIYNLNELAVDFRNASIRHISLKEVDKFLKEVQRVYSNLKSDEQCAASELWLGYNGGEMVVDAYHYDNFFPLINLNRYLTKHRKQVKRFCSDLYGECYANKISFEDSTSHLNVEVSCDNASCSKVTNEVVSIDDIELPF